MNLSLFHVANTNPNALCPRCLFPLFMAKEIHSSDKNKSLYSILGIFKCLKCGDEFTCDIQSYI